MGQAKRKNVSMASIADVLGVSKNAVSLALSNKPGVSDSLREQIRQTAQQMQYDTSALTDDDRKNKCIVVVVPEYIRDDVFFYSEIFWSIEHETRKAGYATLTAGLSSVAERDIIMPVIPDTLEVLGYLAIGIIREEYLNALQQSGKPIISVDIRPQKYDIPSVSTDNMRGGFMAAQYLLSAGITDIGFIGPIYAAQSVYERYCGFRQALIKAGIPERPEYNIFGRRDGFELLDQEQTLIPYVQSMINLPGAWFCAGDLIAVSMLKLLAARNIRVPGDISIIGFDDLKLGEMVTPSLTTMHVDRKLMGKLAVQQLLSMTPCKAESACIHISISCNIVARGSVKLTNE